MAKAVMVELVREFGNQMIAERFPVDGVFAAMEIRGYKPSGVFQDKEFAPGKKYRDELIGQPIFENLCGPMFGGDGVVRYESWVVYDRLSS